MKYRKYIVTDLSMEANPFNRVVKTQLTMSDYFEISRQYNHSVAQKCVQEGASLRRMELIFQQDVHAQPFTHGRKVV